MTTILQPPSSLGYEYQNVPFFDLRNELPVNPNYTWAELAGVRPAEALNTIVCHHDAIPKSKSAKYGDRDIEFAKRIAIDHINSKKNHPGGDAGFPYDVWIRNGTIYWFNDIEEREYGVGSNNGYTVNICVSGDYKNYDTLTPEDRKALYTAIILMKRALPADQHLKGHGEIVPTACPGYDMDQVREDVFALEQKIEQNESPAKTEEIAYRMANHILYLQRMSTGLKPDGTAASDGQKKWAIGQLLRLEPEFRRLGFLE